MNLPCQTVSASPSSRLTARSAGPEARWDWCWLGGRCSASTAPIFSTASAMPSPGRPAFTSLDQHRHRLAPHFGLDLGVDRLVGDDLGAMLEQRQIEEDAGAALGPPLGRRPEQLDRPAADPAGLGAAGRQRHAQRHRRRARSGRSGRPPPSSRTGGPAAGRGLSALVPAEEQADRPVEPGLRQDAARSSAPAASPAPHNGGRRRDRRRSAARRW